MASEHCPEHGPGCEEYWCGNSYAERIKPFKRWCEDNGRVSWGMTRTEFARNATDYALYRDAVNARNMAIGGDDGTP